MALRLDLACFRCTGQDTHSCSNCPHDASLRSRSDKNGDRSTNRMSYYERTEYEATTRITPLDPPTKHAKEQNHLAELRTGAAQMALHKDESYHSPALSSLRDTPKVLPTNGGSSLLRPFDFLGSRPKPLPKDQVRLKYAETKARPNKERLRARSVPGTTEARPPVSRFSASPTKRGDEVDMDGLEEFAHAIIEEIRSIGIIDTNHRTSQGS